jgi:hypothetical protein
MAAQDLKLFAPVANLLSARFSTAIPPRPWSRSLIKLDEARKEWRRRNPELPLNASI